MTVGREHEESPEKNSTKYYMSPNARKWVFGVSDQVRYKPACAATEYKKLEISDVERRGIVLSE